MNTSKESSSTLNLAIRRYRASDRDAVWLLHRTALEPVDADAGDDLFGDLQDIDSSYLFRKGDFLVGLSEGRLVAMGGFVSKNPSQAEIKRMRVHPDFQRRGFGRAMLRALESHAAAKGFAALYLETTVKQTAAMRLYETDGFRQIGRAVVRGFPVIQYEKKLVAGR